MGWWGATRNQQPMVGGAFDRQCPGDRRQLSLMAWFGKQPHRGPVAAGPCHFVVVDNTPQAETQLSLPSIPIWV